MNRSLILSSVALLALAACGEAEKATNEAESAAADVAADTTAAVENATADVTGSTAPADATAASGYATNAALGDMFEIESSRLAVEKAKSPEVKKFAQMMIDAHTKTTDELKSVLSSAKLQVTPPKALDERRQGMVNDLQKASATEFDKTYLDQQTKAHSEALDLHKNYADNGDDAALKAFAAKTAPVVQQHLDEAKKLDESGSDEPAANPPQK